MSLPEFWQHLENISVIKLEERGQVDHEQRALSLEKEQIEIDKYTKYR